jgi:hypothetical protein
VNKSKHVPGPWVLEGNNHPHEVGDHHFSLFTANGYEFGKYNDESLDCGFDVSTPCANARLIAAAPELLETCKLARANITSAFMDFINGNPDDAAVMLGTLRRELTCAIDRAEGRST